MKTDNKKFQKFSSETATKRPRVLLIVDDDEWICRALYRCLAAQFDTLCAAPSVREANHFLDSETITHLICDLNLGNDVPKGDALIAAWRVRYPSIERAVLFTADYMDDVLPGVDAVVQKHADVVELMKALSG